MSKREFQQWLNQNGASIGVDGIIGNGTEAAMLKIFSNTDAPAVTASGIQAIAAELGVSEQQVRAVATVESRGAGFDTQGRPKILFERHYFHRLTKGRHGRSNISNPQWGGYGKSSAQWGRLCKAVRLDPDAAFRSCSWGAFQVMGDHCKRLGYPNVWGMAWTLVQSEGDHYEMLKRFIIANKLQDEMRALSRNPETCRAFARKYNGPAYAKNNYHGKLAAEMR